MLKTLETLIKLSQQELNECRQNIKVMQEKLDDFHRQDAEIDKNIAQEREFATTLDTQLVYNNFKAASQMKQANLRNAIEAVGHQVELLNIKMQDHFMTLKKYQILAEREQENLKRVIDKKLQDELDEISINLHLKDTQ